jgi:hypothetical protein
MVGDWRDFRPAIWLAMFGVAVILLVSPFWYGAIFIGAAIGTAIRIQQRRRRIAASSSGRAKSGGQSIPTSRGARGSAPTRRGGGQKRGRR